jgi:hypothetical protein
LKDVSFHAFKQGSERGIVGPVLPELGNGRGRLDSGNAPSEEVGPDAERLEIASSLLAILEDGELFLLRARLDEGSSGDQFLIVDRA